MLAPAAHPPASWRLCPEALVSRAAGPQQKKARAGAARGDQVSFLPSTPAPGAPHGLACTIPPASPPPQPSATQPGSAATLVLTIRGQASSLLRPHPRPGVRHRAGRVGWGPGARRCPEQPVGQARAAQGLSAPVPALGVLPPLWPRAECLLFDLYPLGPSTRCLGCWEETLSSFPRSPTHFNELAGSPAPARPPARPPSPA